MAGGALDLGDFRRMGEILDGCVAIRATQNRMGAGGMLRGVNGNIFALVGLHSRAAMACQASFIFFRWWGGFIVGGSMSGSEHPYQRSQQDPRKTRTALRLRSIGAHRTLPPGHCGP